MPKLLGVRDGSVEYTEELSQVSKLWYLKKDHSLIYEVLADYTAQDPTEILAVVPAIGSFSAGSRLKSRHPTEEKTVKNSTTGVTTSLWSVKCEYTNELTEDDTNNSDDPTNMRPTVDWEGQEGEEVLEKDAIDGDPIQTFNAEPIILTKPTNNPVLVITRYETFPFDPNVILNFVDHVNANEFYGAPRGSALMKPIVAPEDTVNGVRYCHVTYRIEFSIKKNVDGSLRQDTWQASVLHQGYRYRKVVAGPIFTYLDAGSGNPATVNLDAFGVKLAEGAAPEYISFNKFPEADFNALNLGPF